MDRSWPSPTMRKPYNGLLATGSLSQAARDIRDRAERIGWRLFRAGSENRWGLRCLADHSKVVRGSNLKEISHHLQVILDEQDLGD